jgi:hypothetical protein
VRTQASADLVKAGLSAKPILVEVLKKGKVDLEVICRAEQCLRQIQDGSEAVLATAAARLIAHRKPAGAAQALLDYLPFATDMIVRDELQEALTATALVEGRPEECLVKALAGARPDQRAAAATALVQAGALAKLPRLRQLLKDADFDVRLQVALAMVRARDKAAVPVLIDLVTVLPADRVWKAEEMLARIAGDKGPHLFVDPNTPAAKVQQAWNMWWEANNTALDLSKLDTSVQLGYTLITQMDAKGATGRVLELRPNKDIHWQIEGLRYPLDAQVVGKDRVLIAEYLNRRVTERDFKGTIIWEKHVTMPISVQRLSNGHTFIGTRRQLLIVDGNGHEVFIFNPNVSISAARRLRDGQMIIITTGGVYQRLDAKGRVTKTFQVGPVYTLGGNIDVLPGGRILVPQCRDNRVVEYDADGRVLWQVNVQFPTSAVRLTNGNTLVVSMLRQRVIEVNRDGNEVWSYRTDGRPWRARRR